MAETAILILAAGASSRMRGGDKLLEPVGGMPQLRRLALAALATDAPVLVALPADPGARAGALAGLPVIRVPVADAALGMGRSLAAGAAAAARIDAAGVMVVPGDMPLIDRAAMAALLATARAAPDSICRATTPVGRPGHPVLFPARLFPALAALQDDTGARAVLTGETPIAVTLPGETATLDLDTPEDWATFRASQPRD